MIRNCLKSKMQWDTDTFKATASGFEVENVRGYPEEALARIELLVFVISGA